MKNYLLFALAALLVSFFSCKSISQYPIDDPSMENLDDGIIGRWKFDEDTNKNNFYEILRGGGYATDKYHVIFWNRGGTNATLESNLYFSKIGDARFINVPYFEDDGSGHHFLPKGYFFLKILDVNADFTKMTTATVHDTTLWDINQAGVRQRIARNIDNPAYYYDTVHFYKVK